MAKVNFKAVTTVAADCSVVKRLVRTAGVDTLAVAASVITDGAVRITLLSFTLGAIEWSP